MIEWEIDETYTECENERRMSGHMNKEMKGSFIYRNGTYTSLDRGCSGFYPTTWNFDSSNPFFRVKYLKDHQTHSIESFVAFK